MERTQEDILTALRDTKGIVYYGEILLEVHTGKRPTDNLPLREDARRRTDQLRPTADILNVMHNIDILQRALRGPLIHIVRS